MLTTQCACYVDGVDISACPVLLNYCDNTTVCSWINKKCCDSLLGRRLGRVFAGLMWGREIGVQCEWLSTHANEIADRISRVKREDWCLVLSVTHFCWLNSRNYRLAGNFTPQNPSIEDIERAGRQRLARSTDDKAANTANARLLFF